MDHTDEQAVGDKALRLVGRTLASTVRLDLRIDATVFTHRVSAEEITHDAVIHTPDLVAIDKDLGFAGRLALVDGLGALELVFPDDDDEHGDGTALFEHGAFV